MADLTHSDPSSDAGNRMKPNPVFVLLTILSKTLLPIFVTLFGLAALTFFIGRMLPIDPVASILGDNATQQAYEQMRVALGMDKPLWYQFGVYVKGILSLDFGNALTTGKPVIDDIARVFPATIELAHCRSSSAPGLAYQPAYSRPCIAIPGLITLSVSPG